MTARRKRSRSRYEQVWVGGLRVDHARARTRKAVKKRVRKATKPARARVNRITRPVRPRRQTWNADRAAAGQARAQQRQWRSSLRSAQARLDELHSRMAESGKAVGWSRLGGDTLAEIRGRVLAIPDGGIQPRWNDEKSVWELVGDATGVITRVGQRKGAHAQLMGHALGDLHVLLGAVDRLDAQVAALQSQLAAAQAASCSCGGGGR